MNTFAPSFFKESPVFNFFCITFVTLCMIAYCIISQEYSPLVINTFAILLGLVILSNLKNIDKSEKEYLSKTFFFNYSINILLIFLFIIVFRYSHGTSFLPQYGYNIPDDITFYQNGKILAQAWHTDIQHDIYLGNIKFYGYTYFLGLIFYLTQIIGDFSDVTPRVVNAFLGAFLPILVYLISKLIYDRKVAFNASLFSTIFPVFHYYSALLLRDIIVAFLILLSIYLYISLVFFCNLNKVYAFKFKSDFFIKLFSLMCTLLFIYYMRDVTCFILILAFSTILFFKSSLKSKIAILTCLCLISILFFSNINLEKLYLYITYPTRYNKLFMITENENSLGMQYIINSPFPLNIPLRIIYTMIMPIPPFIQYKFHNLVLGSGAFLWYFVLPFWIFGMWKTRQDLKSNLLTLISLILLVGIAFTSIDIRHKTQFLGLAVIQAAYAFNITKKYRTILYSITTYTLGCLAVIYIYLKFN